MWGFGHRASGRTWKGLAHPSPLPPPALLAEPISWVVNPCGLLDSPLSWKTVWRGRTPRQAAACLPAQPSSFRRAWPPALLQLCWDRACFPLPALFPCRRWASGLPSSFIRPPRASSLDLELPPGRVCIPLCTKMRWAYRSPKARLSKILWLDGSYFSNLTQLLWNKLHETVGGK